MAETDHWGRRIALPPIRREAHCGRVVRCFADRPRSLHETFEHALAINPDGDAVVFGDDRLSYRDLAAQVGEVSAALAQLGIGAGDRVAALLPNRAEYVTLIYAVARLGAILLPLNIREAAPELAWVLNDSGARLLVYDATLVANLPAPDDTPELAARQDIDTLFAALRKGSAAPVATVHEDEVALLLYTSGTTGRPKGAMLTHCNIVHSIMHYQLAMEIGPADRSILAVPISHVTGLVALVATIIGAGATLIIMPEFKAERFLDLAAQERMTHSLIVPAMFNLCLLQPAMDTVDLTHWRMAGYGGAIMPAVTIETIARRLPGLKLMNCYGATETCSPAVLMPPACTAARSAQVGLPVPCGEIAIMDEEGRELPPGEAGEIWIGGPMVAAGYWRNEDATAREFTGGFWRSGDVGVRDADGFIAVVDRIKDVINRGGYKIFASEVENVLLAVPGVIEVAVIAVPCPVLGERVHAHVVAEADVTEAELHEHCCAHLADYKRPEHYVFAEALPRNANGKVLKRMLRDAART